MLCIISGIVVGISFPPFPLPFLIFFGFVPYIFVMQKKRTFVSISRTTYLTAFIFTLITLYWVGSWTKEADLFLMISGILLMFVNPALYLIPSTLYYFTNKIFNRKVALFFLPLFWVSFEYAYSLTDLRFPWLTLGNSLSQFNQFIQVADIVGVYGLTLIILYINIFIYLSFIEMKRDKKLFTRYALAAVLLFILPMIYGGIKIAGYTEPRNKIKIGLIQPNLDPWEKWSGGGLDEQLDIYLNLSNDAVDKGAKLIVWPESALPVYLLSGNYFEQVQRIRDFVKKKNVFLMTGMPDINIYFNEKDVPPEAKKTRSGIRYTSYNSILFFRPDSKKVKKYGKIMLVPFGEKVPFVEEFPFLGDFIKWQVGISSWNVGKEKVLFDVDNHKVGGVICIESIYPDFVAGFVQKGAELIAVVTNDSWYGYSSGPFQHKEIAVLRAVENRRTVVRAANGGISCMIDPAGKIINNTKLFTKAELVVDAPLNSEITFYSMHPLLTPLFCSSFSVITILFFIYIKMSKKNKKPL
jgi:apolipoprotein N-acyltransferase